MPADGLREATVAALNYYTPVLYFFYPLSLAAGETVDVGIIYSTAMQVLSNVTVQGGTAQGVPFTIGDSTITVHGPGGDAPNTDTTCTITLTNGAQVGPVEFAVQSWTVFY
jgi:hypothetical protein